MDIQWQQRLATYSKVLAQLKDGVQLFRQRPLSPIEQQGLIKAFEFTYELAWNVMKDFLEYQGITNIIGSRDAFREAFQKNLVKDGDMWMEMIKSRNQTSHVYHEGVAKEIVEKIANNYLSLFIDFEIKILAHKN
ncbi:MAG: nucleotidyltransferase substrate binding protein [Pseudobdellovibrionaceae bacterium]